MYKVTLDDVGAWTAQQEGPGESVGGRSKEKRYPLQEGLKGKPVLAVDAGKRAYYGGNKYWRVQDRGADCILVRPPLPTELFSSDFIIAPYKTGYPPLESHATISAVLVGETQSAIIPFKRSGVGRNSLSFQQMCAGKRREGDITACWASNKARFMFP